MGRWWVWPLAVILSGLMGADEGWAFRCGYDLIGIGDHKVEVLRSCGEPDFVETWTEKRHRHILFGGHFFPTWEYVIVEEWTYNLGPSRFIRFLRFANGRVEKIETGDYGFR